MVHHLDGGGSIAAINAADGGTAHRGIKRGENVAHTPALTSAE